MKVSHGGSNVIDSRGIQSEARFQILANPHAFRILSSGLYSQKIPAVLREIGCNAADAHVVSGQAERPFEVKLPSALDPQFYIQDWGPGLSHDDIVGLFTTYFSSSKSDTDDLTGAFGLGSKSPFSYTDAFTVTTVQAGEQRVYTAHIGGDGAPVISLLSTLPAEAGWEHGMRVAFPVAPKDTADFIMQAELVYRWFAVPPTLPGHPRPRRPDFLLEGSNFALPAPGARQLGSPRVIMGNVAYPIHPARLGEISPLVRALCSANVHLWVPIGAVVPTASREELEYDERTRDTLIGQLLAVAGEIADLLVTKAREPAETEWLRHQRLLMARRQLPAVLISHLPDILERRQDLDAQTRQALIDVYNLQTTAVPRWVGRLTALTDDGDAGPVADLSDCEVHCVRLIERGDRTFVVRRRIEAGAVAEGGGTSRVLLAFLDPVEIVYANTTHAWPRVKAGVANRGDARATVLLVGPDRRIERKAAAAATVAYAHRLSEALGGVPVTGTDAYPEPLLVKARRQAPRNPKAVFNAVHSQCPVRYHDFHTADGTCFSGSPPDTKLADIPVNGRYYLVRVERQSRRGSRYVLESPPHGGRCLVPYHDVQEMLDSFRQLGARGVPVPPIDGVVVLAGSDVRDYKLRDNGFQSVSAVIESSLRDPVVHQALVSGMGRMPHIDLTTHYSAWRDAGFLGGLAYECRDESPFWQAVAPVIAEVPVLAAVIAEIVGAHRGLRVLLAEILKVLPDSRNLRSVYREPVPANELREELETAYPGLRYLDDDQLKRRADKHPEDVRQALRCLLFTREQMLEKVPVETPLLAAVG